MLHVRFCRPESKPADTLSTRTDDGGEQAAMGDDDTDPTILSILNGNPSGIDDGYSTKPVDDVATVFIRIAGVTLWRRPFFMFSLAGEKMGELIGQLNATVDTGEAGDWGVTGTPGGVKSAISTWATRFRLWFRLSPSSCLSKASTSGLVAAGLALRLE